MRLDRTLVFTPAGRLVLLDLVEADEPRAWTFLLRTDRPTEEHADGTRLIRSGEATARVRRLAPDEASVRTGVLEVEAHPTSSTPELRLVRTLHTLDVTTAACRSGLFLTAITPDAACAVAGAELTEGYGVRFADGEESVFLSPVDRRVRGDGLSADAAAVLLSADGAPYVVAATRLELAGRVLLDVPEPYTGKVG